MGVQQDPGNRGETQCKLTPGSWKGGGWVGWWVGGLVGRWVGGLVGGWVCQMWMKLWGGGLGISGQVSLKRGMSLKLPVRSKDVRLKGFGVS